MRRLTLLLGAVPVGLVTGLAAWFAAGGPAAAVDRISPLEAEISGLPKAGRRAAPPRSPVLADLAASPLFVMTVGPGAVSEPSVRVDGLSVSSRRSAALISIAGQPPDWLSVGETRDGVTLEEISGSKILIETAVGEKEIALGEQADGTQPPPPAAAAQPTATLPAPAPPVPRPSALSAKAAPPRPPLSRAR